MTTSSRRPRSAASLAAASLASLGLAVSGLVAAPAAAVVPDPAPADPRPAALGAAWLTGQLQDGLMYNAQYAFDDLGLSIDTALALAAVGGHDGTVTEIVDAVERGVAGYVTGGQWGPDDRYAGAFAKALVAAQTAGSDPADFGGFDLVAGLEERVSDDSAHPGRIEDRSAWGDYANVVGQSFAARGLSVAGSPEAGAATDYLLDQQCSEGFFRLGFAEKDAAEQGCDADPDAAPDADATALAAINLALTPGLDQTGQDAVRNAADWLLTQQRADGSLGGGVATEGMNANSTGLAGWAFGLVGETDAAVRAATWLRARQADDLVPCTTGLTPHAGALAYDDAALAAGRQDGIPAESADQWRRASTQALPALVWAPAGGDLAVDGRDGFVPEGSSPRLTVTGLAPGQSACVSGVQNRALVVGDLDGTARTRVTLPEGTQRRSFAVRAGAGSAVAFDRHAFHVLGERVLSVVPAQDRVARRAGQTVRVKGLAGREPVRVLVDGRVVDRGEATRKGRYTATFGVGAQTGKAKVRVVGKYAKLRSGRAAYRVVR